MRGRRGGETAGFFIRAGLGRPKRSHAKVEVRGARLQAVVWEGTQSFCSKYVNHKGGKDVRAWTGSRVGAEPRGPSVTGHLLTHKVPSVGPLESTDLPG